MLNIIFTVSTELVGIIIGTIVLLKLSSQLFWFVIAMLVIYILIFILDSTYFKEKSKKIPFILFRINDRIESNYKWQISNCNAE